MLRGILSSGLILSAALAAGGEPEKAPAPRAIPIPVLVKQLGSGDPAEREAAAKRLGAMALEPPPELLAAAKSGNADVSDRAAKLVQAMRWNLAASRMGRGERFAEQGRIDLFVAATAIWDLKADDPCLWEPAYNLGRRLIEKADMKGDRKPHNCPSSFKDFTTYRTLLGPRFTRTDATYVQKDPQKEAPPLLYVNESIQAPGIETPVSLHGGIILSRGSIDVAKGIVTSVVFANGDVTARNALHDVVIVSDGDVTTNSFADSALIVARGNILLRRGASESVLVAGGRVILGEERHLDPAQCNVIKERDADSLWGRTFFELSTVGVEVKPVGGAVQVTVVAPGRPFAAAGVKAGDIVAEVNGKKPDSAESLRRLLRDALAVGDAEITLRRGDKTETVKVALPD